MKTMKFSCSEACGKKLEIPIDLPIDKKEFPFFPWIPRFTCVDCGYVVFVEVIEEEE